MKKKPKANLEREIRALRKSLARCPQFGAVTFIEAARVLALSPVQLGRRVASGSLLVIVVRGEKMIPRSEVRRMLERAAAKP